MWIHGVVQLSTSQDAPAGGALAPRNQNHSVAEQRRRLITGGGV